MPPCCFPGVSASAPRNAITALPGSGQRIRIHATTLGNDSHGGPGSDVALRQRLVLLDFEGDAAAVADGVKNNRPSDVADDSLAFYPPIGPLRLFRRAPHQGGEQM